MAIWEFGKMANGKATKEIGRCLMWGPSSMGIINLQNPKWKWWVHMRKNRKEKTTTQKKKLIAWTTFGAICIAHSPFSKRLKFHMAPHGYAFHVVHLWQRLTSSPLISHVTPFILYHTKIFVTCVFSILQNSNIYTIHFKLIRLDEINVLKYYVITFWL